jgi:hypothetical protein
MANKIKLQQKFPLQFGSFLTITFVGEPAFVLQRSSSNGRAWKDNTQKSYHSQIPYQYFQLFPIQNSNSGPNSNLLSIEQEITIAQEYTCSRATLQTISNKKSNENLCAFHLVQEKCICSTLLPLHCRSPELF